MKAILISIGFAFAFLSSFGQSSFTVNFGNCVGEKRLVLNDSIYTNSFGENFTVSKLKYYITTHIVTTTGTDSFVTLIDASKEHNTINVFLPDHFLRFEFVLGVDSALNCSGAQSGALDPLNDMFWTWNNGYVMFKMEGKSESSAADDHRIEYHIGGYKGPFKTMRKLKLSWAPNVRGIDVKMDLNMLWNGVNPFRISSLPVEINPGEKAAQISDNFPKMFSVFRYHYPV